MWYYTDAVPKYCCGRVKRLAGAQNFVLFYKMFLDMS